MSKQTSQLRDDFRKDVLNELNEQRCNDHERKPSAKGHICASSRRAATLDSLKSALGLDWPLEDTSHGRPGRTSATELQLVSLAKSRFPGRS